MVSTTLLPAAIAILFISIIVYTSPCASFNAETGGTDGFSVRLMHRDSPQSPLYDPTLTVADRSSAAVRRSISRLNYFESVMSSSPMEIAPKLTPGTGEYLMFFHLGTPPAPVYAIADTGSHLTWIQCLPCKSCYNQTQPIFDPSKSSTYEKVPCSSPACGALQVERCTVDTKSCYYDVVYGDGSVTMGVLSGDTLTFEDPFRNNVTFRNVAFGCSDDTSGLYERDQGGVVGLDRNPFSLISQLSVKQFSYCMVPPNQDDSGSRMQFGSNAVISGDMTPLASESTAYYYLTLEGISVGNDKLPIPDGIFSLTQDSKGGFVIDSGATYTMLRVEAFLPLVDALGEKIKLQKKDDPRNRFELCFVAGSFDELASAPVITFHFKDADIVLPQQNTYTKAFDWLWCLAMLPSLHISILGNFQQQNFHVGYDISKKLVSFAASDCAAF
ncbi:hypothetical protein HHK36_026572 [Tetracentron sinense]|uniref:Peptidase A1 domain-containing protein n=1 Tax=Tetracentron sinense TaxID=13715 RepID=A0A834YH43_TETSI|nr:hypothetical protein HHK36_026572 [Tetracentron sinense]